MGKASLFACTCLYTWSICLWNYTKRQKKTKKKTGIPCQTFTNKSDEKVRWWSAFSFSFPQLQYTAHELDRKLFMIVAGLVVDPAIQSSCTCKDTLNISVSYTVGLQLNVISYCRLGRRLPLWLPLLPRKYPLLRTSRHLCAYDTGCKFMSRRYSFILSTILLYSIHITSYNHINQPCIF